MKRYRFSQRIVIRSTPTEAFDYTQDYGKRLRWDTFLKRAELMDGAVAAGMGVRAYCVARNGLGMVTEYVSFNRPKVTAVKMTRGPMLFTSFLGSWSFREMEKGQTEVTFLYSFSLRFPFLLFGRPILRNLRTNVRQRLADLKHNMERG